MPDNSALELPMFSWPELDPKALYGLAGEVVNAGAYTNVEPAGLLIAFLTAVGATLTDTGLRALNTSDLLVSRSVSRLGAVS